MKSTSVVQFTAGLASSILHSIGFIKAAEKLDPMMRAEIAAGSDRRSAAFTGSVTNFRVTDLRSAAFTGSVTNFRALDVRSAPFTGSVTNFRPADRRAAPFTGSVTNFRPV